MGLESLDREAFTQIRDRLDEIATQVRGDDMPLDAALDLYDEAVKLGMKATELLETLDASDSSSPTRSFPYLRLKFASKLLRPRRKRAAMWRRALA